MFWLLVSLCLLQSHPTQTPPRESQAPRAGTATIRGRVTDKETGLPVPRVVVQLAAQQFTENPIAGTTDDDGRYTLLNVPAGHHTVIATMPVHRTMYLPQVYGESAPMDPLRGPGARAGGITVADGETRNGVDIQLTRALGISGRVVNEFGEPMSNVHVRLESATGREVPTSGFARTTDDRGAFRLFGLRPGNYRVCADPNRSVGGRDAPGDSLLTTCYPAGDDPNGLMLVAADPPDVEIRVRRGRTFSISGTVVDASGAPADQVNMSITSLPTRNSGFSYNISTRPGGRFTVTGLTPGDYVITARVGNRYNPLETRERQVGTLPVRVDAIDVEGLLVTVAKSARVSGKLVLDDGPLPDRTRIAVIGVMDEEISNSEPGPGPSAVVSDDLTFDLSGLFGPVQFECAGLPPGWVVKAVRYEDRDITGKQTEFPPGAVSSVDIVVSSRGATISGAVADESGKPVTGGQFVVVLPVDASATWQPQFMPAIPVLKDGTFRTPAQRAGEYWIAAVDAGQLIPLLNERANLKARLSKVAQRIQLSEGERRTIDLRVVKLPEDR